MSAWFRPPCRWAAVILASLAGSAATGGVAVEVEFARLTDPNIDPPKPVPSLSSRPLPLWIEALASPEADLRREAADTIALAHRLGMPDLQTAVPALAKALDAPDQHPLVVAAVARALIALDARQAAPSLHARAQAGGMELAQIVEPALARWDYRPVRAVWLARLSDPAARRMLLFLAMDGLAAVGEKEAATPLLELAVGPSVEPAVRVAAARALGQIKPEGLEAAAAKLASHPSAERMGDRLVAARLLRRHGSEGALSLLVKLALDREPAVAAAALERLVERDFRRVLPISDPLLTSEDANVRRLAAQAWVAERTPAAVGRLGKLLDDPHPGVRVYVRESFLAMTSDPPLREAVLDSARGALAGRQWRALEQSAIIMAALDRKETAGRLVELLEFERPEVFIAAAWGLRRLAVPSTRPAILRKARRIHDSRAPDGTSWDVDQQFCHLVEALGLMRAEEAMPLLRQYIPKNPALRPAVRADAIWAMGHILADKPDPQIVAELCERIADVMSLIPEAWEVRAMSAVTMGRMRAKSALGTLRKFSGGRKVGGSVEYACGWAIHMIAGEPLPVFVPFKLTRGAWFLQPLE